MGVNQSTADYVRICVEFYFYLLFLGNITSCIIRYDSIRQTQKLMHRLKLKKALGKAAGQCSVGRLAPLIQTLLVPG